MSAPPQIFNRSLVRRHRDRAARNFTQHGALRAEVAALLLERIRDVKRDFRTVLELGAGDAALSQQLAAGGAFAVAADLSPALLRGGGYTMQVAADEEWLPFADAAFDLVVCNLNLHWVNDLPGTLAQIKRVLKPDGLMLAAFPGGGTLHELRVSLLEAELVLSAGAAPRLSPQIDMQTASGLLQRAGFRLPVTDREVVTLAYDTLFALMRDLRGMGESAALAGDDGRPASRTLFAMAEAIYRQRFALPDGLLPATFELVFLHGWH